MPLLTLPANQGQMEKFEQYRMKCRDGDFMIRFTLSRLLLVASGFGLPDSGRRLESWQRRDDITRLFAKGVSITAGIFVCALCLEEASAGSGPVRFDKQKVSDEEIKLVVGRVRDGLIGKSYPDEKPVKRDGSAESRVQELLAAQNRQADSEFYGSFSEVRQKDAQDIDFARGYFDPIRELALAYSSPASRFYHRSEVKEVMHVAFAYTHKHVYPKCPKRGNWWVWAKQMPDCHVDILALMAREFQPEDRQYITSVLDYLLGTGPIPGNGYHHGKLGKDALNSLVVGIVTGDRVRIARGWECMENEVSPYLLEADGTPLMSLLTKEFLGISLPYVYEGYDTGVEWAQLTRGTSMALRPETTGKITRYLLDLGRWNTFEGTEVAWISFTSYRVFWRPPGLLRRVWRNSTPNTRPR
jgi:hypothetical protein